MVMQIVNKWHKCLRLLPAFAYKGSTQSWLFQKNTCKKGMCHLCLIISPPLLFASAASGQFSHEIFYRFKRYWLLPGFLHSSSQDIEHASPSKTFTARNNEHIPSIISITAHISVSESKVALQNTSLFFKWLNKASYPPSLASVWRQYCRFGLDTRPSGLARELAN